MTLGAVSVTVSANTQGFAAAMQAAAAKLGTVAAAAAKASTATQSLGITQQQTAASVRQLNAAAARAAASTAQLTVAMQGVDMHDTFSKAAGFAGGLAVKAGIAAGALGALGADVIKTASDFFESTNVIDTAFGKLAPTVDTWAVETGKAMGRSTMAVREYAGGLQALLAPMLGSSDQAARMSTEFAKLAIDLGSFWNVADDEALTRLRSGLVGETEPMRKFGVDLQEASLQALAFSMGIKTNVQDMDQSTKVGLRYLQIMKQTALAQGDAIKTASGLENSTKALGGAVDNLKVSFGTQLLPVAASVVQSMTEMVRSFQELDPTMQKAIGYTAGVTAGLLAATAAAGGLAAAIFSIAALASGPAVGALVAGIGALSGVFIVIGAAVLAFTAGFEGAKLIMDAFGFGIPQHITAMQILIDTIDMMTGALGRESDAQREANEFQDETLYYLHQMDIANKQVAKSIGEVGQSLDQAKTLGDLSEMSLSPTFDQSLVQQSIDGQSALADAAKIGSDVQVKGALSAAEAEKKRLAALEKSKRAAVAFADVQRKAGLDAAKARAAPGARGVADIMSGFSNDLSELSKKGKAAHIAPGAQAAVRADLFAGVLGDLKAELEGLPFKEFGEGMNAAIAELAKAGQSSAQIAAFRAGVRAPKNPGNVALTDIATERAGISDQAQPFGDLAAISRETAASMAALDESLRLQGASAAKRQEVAAASIGLATDKTVAAFNAQVTSIDDANVAYAAAAGALEALGGSVDDLRGRLQVRPQSLADLLSGPVGSGVDGFSRSLSDPISPTDRSSMVQSISDALSNAISGGGLDLTSISKALGTAFGASGGLDGLLGGGAAGGAAGIAGGPAGAAIGVAVGALLATAASAVGDGLKAILDDFGLGLADITGDGRLTSALDAMVSPTTLAASALIVFAPALLVGAAALATFTLASLALVATLAVFAVAFAPVILALGALAALIGTVAMLAGIFSLSLSTDSFKRFQQGIAAVVDKMVKALEPFWTSMLPLVGLFDALAQVAMPLFTAFAGTSVASRVLFEVFKFGAIVFGGLLLAVGYLQDGILNAVTQITLGMAALIGGLNGLPLLGDLIPDDMASALAGIANAANGMRPDLDAMGASLVDLTKLTYDEAATRGEILSREKAMSEELTNIPQGFKVVAARFRAIIAEDFRSGVPGSDVLSAPRGGVGQAITMENVYVTANNPEELIEKAQRIAERRAFQRTGTTGTRDGQNNGR